MKVDKSTNNKRIFKNTAVLYIRMIVVMLISLYTSRLVLRALGVDDFGLYNVVGGVVGLMVFFNTTMAKTTQRFLNVAMVNGEKTLSNIFSTSITVHLMFALLFLLVGESLGLWFLNAKIVIPEGREVAANVVYQAALISFCISILTTPYNAAVIAYEKMSFIAIVSIIDSIAKLGIALFLLSYNSDRLSIYGILLLVISFLNFAMYFLYCRMKNSMLKFCLSFNKENFQKILAYASWTILGQFAIVGCNQGNVVLVNMFHSLTANAAMSVGSQINHAITNLTSNFQTAFNPQITKSYAEGDYSYLKSLSYSTSKISFCILFLVALPICYNMDWVLDVWLDKVPNLSNTFAMLFIINGIMNAISSPFNFTVLSSGNIRNYQIIVSLVFLLDLPIAFFLFSIGLPPTSIMWVKIGVMSMAMLVRLYYASKIVPTISVFSYFREVFSLITVTTILSVTIALFMNHISISNVDRIVSTIILEIVCLLLLLFVCLNKKERNSLIRLIKTKV